MTPTELSIRKAASVGVWYIIKDYVSKAVFAPIWDSIDVGWKLKISYVSRTYSTPIPAQIGQLIKFFAWNHVHTNEQKKLLLKELLK